MRERLPAPVCVTLENVLFQCPTYHSESLEKHTVNVYKIEKEYLKDLNYCSGIFFFVNSGINLVCAWHNMATKAIICR